MKLFKILLSILMFITISVIIAFFILPKNRVIYILDEEVIYEYKTTNNALIRKPIDPIKEGYAFSGWFFSKDGIDTKWNFSVNRVENKTTTLEARFELLVNYITITNISINKTIVTWDKIDDAKYEIAFGSINLILDDNFFDFEVYKLTFQTEKVITLKPIKAGYESITKKMYLKYTGSKIEDGYFFDFENVNKTTYQESQITYGAFNFVLREALISNSSSDDKHDLKSIRMRQNGEIEIKDGIKNFYSLSFYFSRYKYDNRTLLSIYMKNSDTDWEFITAFEASTDFRKVVVTYRDLEKIDINQDIYIKIVKDANESRVNVDDIRIKTLSDETYRLTIDNEIKLLPYYQSIIGKTGEELVLELREIINKDAISFRFSDTKSILQYIDKSIEDKNVVRLLYANQTAPAKWIEGDAGWIREHIWPNIKLGVRKVTEYDINLATDLHNIRTGIFRISNLKLRRHYTETLSNSSNYELISTDSFFPGNNDKGDIARILLYMAVRYETLFLTSDEGLLKSIEQKNYQSDFTYMGNIKYLLNWHLEDPVDLFEINRNDVIFDYQHNRNPFVDHPELFEEVYKYFLRIDEERILNPILTANDSIDYYKLSRKHFLFLTN